MFFVKKLQLTKLVFASAICLAGSMTPSVAYADVTAEYLSIGNRHVVQMKHGTEHFRMLNIKRANKILINFNDSVTTQFTDLVTERLVGAKSSPVTSFKALPDKDGKLSVELSYDGKYIFNQTDNNGVLNISFSKKAPEKANMVRHVISNISFFDSGKYTKLRIRGKKIEDSDFSVSSKDGGKLIVSLPYTDIDDNKDNLVGSKFVESIKTIEGEAKSSIELSLVYSAKKEHRVIKGTDMIDIIIGEKLVTTGSSLYTVEDVNFKASGVNATLSVKTSIRNPSISYVENDNNTIIEIKGADIEEKNEMQYDVSEFATTLSGFEVKSTKDGVIVKVDHRENYHMEFAQFRDLSQFTFEPMYKAQERGSEGKTDTFAYNGEKISLDFTKVSVRNAISMIARTNEMNFVIADNVKGSLTMVLNEVPWDQVLDLILRTNGLGKEVEGNVIRIASLTSLSAEYAERAAIEKGKINVEPLVTEYIKLKYKKAIDVKAVFDTLIKSTESAASDAGAADAGGASAVAPNSSGFLSQRGTIMVDVEKNILVVRDTQRAINDVKRLMSEIDMRPQQIMIEARIVEASDTFSKEFGVKWGGTFNKMNNGRMVSVGAPNGTTAGNIDAMANGTTIIHNSLVDLGAAIGAGAGGGIGISAGLISGTVLDLELSAAEAAGEIKIVSKPKILVIDGRSANINQGTDIPFQTVSAQNGTNVEFKKANLGLVVTPDIKGKNEIQLHVLATKDSPSASSVGNNPIISTKQVESDVIVGNGETIVIGGIYTEDNGFTEAKVPGLSDLPLIGGLFKAKKRSKGRTELLIFITARIVSSNAEIMVEASK